MWVRHRVNRLLYVMLCTVLQFAACSEVAAAPDRAATQADHACPDAQAAAPHRPIGFDGRRIRPVD